MGWYRWNGVDVFSAGGKNKKLFSRIRTWNRILTQLKEIHHASGIGILHSFWLSEATFIAQRFARRRDIKHVATIFGQDALRSNKYLSLLNLSKMTVVANSEFTAATFLNATNHPVDRIIHFEVNTELINNSETGKTNVDIIGVGALTKIKIYFLFLEIIRDLVQDFPNLKVIIIGEGEEREQIEEYIRDNELSNAVALKGLIPRREVLHYMKESKLFLHTSSYESSCHARLEALACGCFVLTFDNGYLPEHPLIHISKTKEEMISVAKELLRKDRPAFKAGSKSISETVKAFHEIYFS